MNQHPLRSVVFAATLLAGLPLSGAATALERAAFADPTGVTQDPVQAENVAAAQSLYRAFAANDGATIGALLAPELVWNEGEGGPYADRNPYVGPQAVFEGIFARIGAAFPDFTVNPETYLPSGDRVVVLGRYKGTNAATGEALDAQFVHVWTVSDGRIVAMQQYTDTAQWVDVVTPD